MIALLTTGRWTFKTPMTEVQTRNEIGAIRNFATIKEALKAADQDPTIWKISFSFGSERVVLDRRSGWMLRENWIMQEWAEADR